MGFFLYFDPGTGALIVQFLAAAVAGVVLFYKTIVGKIRSFFGMDRHASDDLPENHPTEDEK